MKSLTTKLLAVAALVAAAGIASAQTMKADVPFSFQVGGKTFASGLYRVQLSGDRVVIAILAEKSNRGMLTTTYPGGDPKASWRASGQPVLSFRCSGGECALTSVWMGVPGDPALGIPAPSLRKDAPVTTAEVVLHPVKGD